jgi:transposase
MYPLDRRQMAIHVYKLFQSLRKTAIILQVSHTSISRWLKNPERKQYTRNQIPKSLQIIESIKVSIANDPFITILKLKELIKNLFSFSVSRELIRTAILKGGLSRKKARFFGKPKDYEVKLKSFIEKRTEFQNENRTFVSLDETSFGRHGRQIMGYAPIGKQLRLLKSIPRVTTVSSLVVASNKEIIKRQEIIGSFNTKLFTSFIENLLLPKGTVILLDNVSFHHSKSIKDLVFTKGYELLFVPPYSPWYNPIEGIFSIVKRSYYKDGNIEKAFKSVTAEHCDSFFKKSFCKTI